MCACVSIRLESQYYRKDQISNREEMKQIKIEGDKSKPK